MRSLTDSSESHDHHCMIIVMYECKLYDDVSGSMGSEVKEPAGSNQDALTVMDMIRHAILTINHALANKCVLTSEAAASTSRSVIKMNKLRCSDFI